MDKYAVIVGHGRSGTNWLHELFNNSEETYCRNEPHELLDSPISELNDDRVTIRADDSKLISRWDELIDIISNRMSDIDPWILEKKKYFKLGKALYIALRSNKLRKLLSFGFKSLKKDEWDLPTQSVKQSEWNKAYRIFKFVQSPGWAVFLLKNRAHIAVFHIVRHPGGFLNSWKNRYLSAEEEQQVHADNIQRLKTVSEESTRWADVFGDINNMDLNESELWYWYYANQVIYEEGRGKAAYTLIQYEELTKHTVNVLDRLYRAIGLVITADVKNKVLASSQNSENISSSWQKKLSVSEISLCERFASLASDGFLKKIKIV